ncbi:MAG: hypothetical protein JSR69_21060 [Proteobacteria bacterium]|nr:hypothetical protein [Pseudomonadota bacterium]
MTAAFGQLAALLNIIKEKAPEYSEAAKLAALGCYIANDLENYADTTCAQMRKGGIAQT